MKVCFSSIGNNSDSILDPRFGRAAYFAIADTDTMEFDFIENTAAATGGAAITAGQMMVDKGVEAVVTGSVGPNAMDVLKAAGIKMYKGASLTIRENLEKFQEETLQTIDAAVPQHHGLQGGNK